jgi:hypothetical protein
MPSPTWPESRAEVELQVNEYCEIQQHAQLENRRTRTAQN